MSRHCAFLTLEERGDFVIDDEVAIPALEEAGWRVSTVPWRQRDIPWSAFDLVIVRSTWDYWDDTPGFLRVLAEIDGATRLANPLPLMRWNLSKTYLRDLEAADVPVVPTHWFDALDAGALAATRSRFAGQDLVVKPQVGGNGQGVLRLPATPGSESDDDALHRYASIPGMLQPFRPAVLEAGEASLFYFGGVLSHAIGKRPAVGEFRSQEERGATITPLDAPPALRTAGDRALAALPDASLYARVDLLDDGAGVFEVVELELIEPSLYFRTNPGAPVRFAAAVDAWWAGPGEPACGGVAP